MSRHFTTGYRKTPIMFVTDDIDDALLDGWKCHQHSKGYIVAARRVAGERDMVYLHRLLTGAPPHLQVDHKDGDPTNNRRLNLRVCAPAQQSFNKKMRRRASGLPRGVVAHKSGRFRARIGAYGKNIDLGYHPTAEAASQAYEQAAARYFGEFKRQDLP